MRVVVVGDSSSICSGRCSRKLQRSSRGASTSSGQLIIPLVADNSKWTTTGELGGGPVNLAGVRSAQPVPASPWPPRAAHRPEAARTTVREMGGWPPPARRPSRAPARAPPAHDAGVPCGSRQQESAANVFRLIRFG